MKGIASSELSDRNRVEKLFDGNVHGMYHSLGTPKPHVIQLGVAKRLKVNAISIHNRQARCVNDECG